MNEIPDGHSHVIAHSTVTPENPQKERWTTSAWWGVLKDSIRKIVAPCSNYLSSPPPALAGLYWGGLACP